MLKWMRVKAKEVVARATCHRAMYLAVALAYGAAVAGVEKEVVEAVLCGAHAMLWLRK